MYLTIREYQTDPTSVEEILRQDKKSFVPFIAKAEGFLNYDCIDSGNGTVTSVSLFENRTSGEQFNTMAQDWVRQNLGSLLPEKPTVIAGEVRSHAGRDVLVS